MNANEVLSHKQDVCLPKAQGPSHKRGGMTLGARGQEWLEGNNMWTGEDATYTHESQQLWSSEQDQHKSKPVNVSTWGRKGPWEPTSIEDLWIVDGFHGKERQFSSRVWMRVHTLIDDPTYRDMQDVWTGHKVVSEGHEANVDLKGDGWGLGVNMTKTCCRKLLKNWRFLK